MSQVQLKRWRDGPRRYPSYRAQKEASDARRKAVRELLRRHAALKPGELESWTDRVASGGGCMIPVAALAEARLLAEGLQALGAAVVVREMDDACLCPRCQTYTVVRVGEDPAGLELHTCAGCGEIKRPCPDCGGQGWLAHYRGGDPPMDWYECDECGSQRDLELRPLAPAAVRCDSTNASRVIDTL